MTYAAGDRPCIEMGPGGPTRSARWPPPRGVHRRLRLDLQPEAGRRYGIPTVGTAAHAFTLVHDSEEEAFRAQIASLGPGTTLLVDTYDVAEGSAPPSP